MSNSYRIRTTPGVDKSLKIRIDQEFEYLEILSLKLLQSQVYTRQCSDYGVIVGRVSINNGFGVPNAKVSIFIPLTSDDEINSPIIADLYPYKSLTQLNDLGYRYNLLPQEPSYSNHVPTGSFFTKDDVLTNPTKIEIYDKYFKYNAVTNESGDYMIFGVPIGIQTLVVNVDLSDIGEFSLSPQDMTRMGLASESQVNGTKFKSSSNLNELPQIITINRTLEVEPLWGEPDICNLGITRTDFDLSAEKNINILPTAIFMGSIFSTNDDSYQKKNCKPSLNSGELCDLITGPGEILAIRQTINIDSLGRPVLEEYRLESGGQVIDENGTWLVDVPMNLDYVVTNEFGESVISNDKTKGIPTKGKYRFKIKWNQTPTLVDPIKRGYFLAPNIKEYGWGGSNSDPLSQGAGTNNTAAKSSYAFSLDWDDYGPTGTTIGAAMVQEAINCEDKFYDMTYNKVYTISQLITQYRKGVANTRFIAIKNVLDDSCRSENNKFPTNDAYYRLDIIYLLFIIVSFLFRPILFVLIIIMHMVAFILSYLMIPLLLAFATYAAFKIVNLGVSIGASYPSIGLIIPFAAEILAWVGMVALLAVLTVKSDKIKKIFKNVKIPVLTYPDCEFCTCNAPSDASEEPNDASLDTGGSQDSNVVPINKKGTALLSPINNPGLYQTTNNYHNSDSQICGLMSGQQIPQKGSPLIGVGTGILGIIEKNNKRQLPQYTYSFESGDDQITELWQAYSNDIPLPERLNLFNTKAKYFNENSSNNPGGGVNRIKVTFGSDKNDPTTVFHYDNIIAILVTPDIASSINQGQLMTFQDSAMSEDRNTKFGPVNNYGTNQVTGTSILLSATTTNVNVTWADPTSPGNNKTTTYKLTGNTVNNNGVLYKYKTDIEYFQVIKKTTVKDFKTQSSSGTKDTLYQRVFGRVSNVYNIRRHKGDYGDCNDIESTPMSYDNYDKDGKQVLLFLVRGVDPNSPKVRVRYDLSTIYGNSEGTNVVGEPITNPVTGKVFTPLFKLNIPIQGGYNNVDHSKIADNNSVDSYSGEKLFYPSYHFKPGPDMSGFTTTLPRYYSSLNFTNQTIKPFNLYVYPRAPHLSGTDDGVDYPAINRGNYYRGENIEGGSFLTNSIGEGLCVGCNSECRKKNPATTTSTYNSPRYSNSYAWNIQKSTPTENNIVMRSDRLPTSTFDYNPAGTSNYLPLHSNPGFEVYLIDDEGGSASITISTGTANGGSVDAEIKLVGDTSSMNQDVLDSFSCQTLVPLTCYGYEKNKIIIKPKDNECYDNQTSYHDKIMEKGCYIFVTAIFLSLTRDFGLLDEWVARINVNFAACRNVFAHSFVNNWVNGSLFAFSFKNNRYYDKKNQPHSEYCTDTVYLNTDTANFYYRSSPYNWTSQSFVGKNESTGKGIGNKKNLLFPTTIMDLGPRSSYMQEISLSDNYDGYVLNKLNSTTFNDVSELLNYFLITRIANNSVFGEVSKTNVLSFFNRKQNGSFVRMIDGDYAQMISINSELGVTPFDESTYDGDSVFYFGALSPDAAFGVFFSSTTQTRDWISPRRTIINDDVNLLSTCSFNNLPVKTQTVPFYQWLVKPNTTTNTIFGSQENEWYTDDIVNGSFFSNGYQSMDRLLKTSRYYRTKNVSKTNYFKGFIYGVDNSGGLSPSDSNWETNDDSQDRAITVGAPYHFYFGLKKGKSAFDRLTTKWIDTDNITN